MAKPGANEARQLISAGEGQRVEFKRSFAEQNAAIESLGAFANARGGTVLIGVRDDGTIIGANIGANTIENFVNALRRDSQPPLSPDVENISVNGETIVSARVDPAPAGQLIQVFGKALVRVGSTNQVMSPEEQKGRLLAGQRDSGAEAPVQISCATSDNGREAFVWVENSGILENFSVRVTSFHANNPGLEVRPLWRT